MGKEGSRARQGTRIRRGPAPGGLRGGVAGSEAVVNWLDLKTRKEGGCGWLDVEFEEDFGESGGVRMGSTGHLP